MLRLHWRGGMRNSVKHSQLSMAVYMYFCGKACLIAVFNLSE